MFFLELTKPQFFLLMAAAALLIGLVLLVVGVVILVTRVLGGEVKDLAVQTARLAQ
jgi:hypothetical protein